MSMPRPDPVRSVDELSKTHIAHLIAKGEMIEAVKFVKDRFDVSLKDAKDIVEGIRSEERTSRRRMPESGLSNRIPKWDLSNRILLFCCILGIAFASIAVFIYIGQLRSIENSELINGTVIDFNHNRKGLTAPVIEYEWNGRQWLYASSTYSTFAVYALDEKVPIYINREDPADIIIDTVPDRWFVVFVFSVLGVGFIGIPLWVYRVLNRP